MSDRSSALSGSSCDAFTKSMISSDCVGLKPMWKANLGFLFLVAAIVSVCIFAFITK